MRVTRHVTRESSCPKSYHLKPESGCLKVLVMSPKRKIQITQRNKYLKYQNFNVRLSNDSKSVVPF